MPKNDIQEIRDYWENHARHDPLWAILSDPSKKGRKWNARDFFETGQREISILLYHLQTLTIPFSRSKALDFGCGMGRLTQALGLYFDLVVGVDISKSMVKFARLMNRYQDRVQYTFNPADHLQVFRDQEFDFIYTNIVLQHLRPEMTKKYLAEFLRVLQSDGLLIFQLPSHPKDKNLVAQDIAPMNEGAYLSMIRLDQVLLFSQRPSTEIPLKVYIKNISPYDWIQNERAPILVGNHWLTQDGKTMLIQDDGRARLPKVISAGKEYQVYLLIKMPPQEGDYRCEIDLVHESIAWFKEKGASSLSFDVEVRSDPSERSPTSLCHGQKASQTKDSFVDEDYYSTKLEEIYRELPRESEEPEKFPIFGIPKDEVVNFLESQGGAVIYIEEDEHCGKEWVGYRYIVRKK